MESERRRIGEVLRSIQLFLQRAKDATEKKRKRAEKCEELVANVVEHFHWINTVRNFQAFGTGSEPTLSPIVKVRAISDTYFAEFEEFVKQLEITSYNYENWTLDVRQKRLRGEAYDEATGGHADVLKTYMEKREAFLEELRSFARREFQ